MKMNSCTYHLSLKEIAQMLIEHIGNSSSDIKSTDILLKQIVCWDKPYKFISIKDRFPNEEIFISVTLTNVDFPEGDIQT